MTPLLTLLVWAAAGCVLAVGATLVRSGALGLMLNYRASHDEQPGETEPYFDLGSYHRSIETPSAQAQVWFDRGLVWAYAFNHEEAILCFERALALDPDLAIARWGIAYAIGPELQQGVGGLRPRRSGRLAGTGQDGTAAGRGRPRVGRWSAG